jgi:hypothetical protein
VSIASVPILQERRVLAEVRYLVCVMHALSPVGQQ